MEKIKKLITIIDFLQEYYHTAHLQCKGPNFKSDHDLFGALYTGTEGQLDQLSELAIKEFDNINIVNLDSKLKAMAQVSSKFKTELDNDSFFKQGYKGEKEILELLEEIRESHSLGLDNFLADIAELHLHNCYLINQRLGL